MSAFVYSFPPATFLRVAGADSAQFLQGQFTNELRQKPGAAIYGLWLNQKGKVLADSHVLQAGAQEFMVVSVSSPAALIQARLEEYIIADDVAVADETASMHGLIIWGGQSESVVGQAPAAGEFMRSGASVVFAGRQALGKNFLIVGPKEEIARRQAELAAAGATPADAAAAEFARISAGIPAVPQDIGPADLPNEGGLETTAISYTKGCYLGQEVMARLKNLGRIRRRLHIVGGPGSLPPPGTALYQAETKVGEVRSGAARGDRFVALAMLNLANLDPTAGFALAPGGEQIARIIPHE